MWDKVGIQLVFVKWYLIQLSNTIFRTYGKYMCFLHKICVTTEKLFAHFRNTEIVFLFVFLFLLFLRCKCEMKDYVLSFANNRWKTWFYCCEISPIFGCNTSSRYYLWSTMNKNGVHFMHISCVKIFSKCAWCRIFLRIF